MKRNFLLFSTCLLPLLSSGQTTALQSFPVSAVHLLESPFQQAQQTDKAYMLALNPDRLLAPYQAEAGIQPKAERYGNWENTGLDGHIGGHYLSALALMYAATGDAQVQQRLTYMIDALDACQQKNGNGYLGGIPGGKAMWQQVKAGNIKANSFGMNEKWVPWYNLHKTYAGLRDAYLIGGNAKAKTMLVKLTDWCLDLTANLTDAQIQDMLRSEHGGLNEVFADVASITGDSKYLTLAHRFSHRAVLEPLLGGKDVLNGMHANTQIPKVIGFERIAEVGGDPTWTNAATFFWKTVVENRTVSIGGNSVSEHFNPADNFTSMLESTEGPETCNTYNMLKLTKQLYLTSASTRYLDYYERALYNHILSSQHPGQGGFVYFTPMRPRHYRVYSEPQEGFWCCVGSGLENHGKYGELVYAHRAEQELLVNLFVPSRLSWVEQGLTLTQQTTFPFEERSQLALKLKKPRTFALSIRQPGWLPAGKMAVQVNGKPVAATASSPGYATVTRKWRSGDVVTVALPMETKAEYLPDHSSWVSFVHGPVVLAAVTDTTDLTGLRANGQRMAHVPTGQLYPIEDAPVLVSTSQNVAEGIKPVAGRPLTFTAAGLVDSDHNRSVQLVPFYQIHDARYMVYWPVTTPEGLAARKEEIRRRDAEKRALEARTIDQVTPGEQQPESDHGFQGEQSETGTFRNRHWRHAAGWFSYNLRNPNKAGRALRVTYSGGDKNRQFTILVNGAPLAKVALEGNPQREFYDVEYALPEALRRNAATTLIVKFVAAAGSTAGGVYDVRLLK
ncbi:glycoside hydrolase family 127 protein (plasmid) [Hymenobacter tibetensis]|uniref:Glycoside hydrolase family 127 protein n=1 Tax=Hymenobacter tibetensis TaxID=497967 RepID=A0ABY4D8L8_9BACT|nr:glycoside hydrolase family 127 protein [Hymenobacter tibetensis]UOG77561.1 glycoside hydrolase family 127 protein [Hymenobacter tibetensis]